MRRAVFLMLATAALVTSSVVVAQTPSPSSVTDRKVESFELRDETFIDGLAKLNEQVPLGLALELPLKERISDANVSYLRFNSSVPGGTVRGVLNYLCALDPHFGWSSYKNTINVYPLHAAGLGDKYFMNRRLSDTKIEISDLAQGIFKTIETLPGSPEQIAFSQSGALPGFSHAWTLSPDGLTLRQAFDEIALHMGAGYGWTLGGANEFRVIRFHAKLLPSSDRQAEDQNQVGPYIQIVSLTVEPQTIHTTDKPGQAVLSVGLIVQGNVPSGSTATLELITSAAAPSVKLCNQKRAETVHLDSNFIRVEFPVEPCPDTTPGKVALGVTVRGTTAGVVTKRSPSDKSQTAQLEISVP